MCAGCGENFALVDTYFYRNKRCCSSPICRNVIDGKVTNTNYKKRQRKIEKGTFRNGVDQELRLNILDRDGYTCALCEVHDTAIGIMQVHHIVPVSHGGTDDSLNLITVCKNCHDSIHNNGWERYIVSLKETAEKMECILR
jgi:5-methylcytosine-specific restriction enzyme A